MAPSRRTVSDLRRRFTAARRSASKACCLAASSVAAFLTVGTSRADTVFTVSTSADNGAGSLRQAILDANDLPGKDLIQFSIPGNGVHSLNLLAALPQIVDPVVIDGTTQPGYSGLPLIELKGSNAGSGTHGLLLLAGNCTIRGLIINRFHGDGIHIEAEGANVIQGNFLGTDSTGRSPQGNQQGGISIFGSLGNQIGGTNAIERNLISGGNGSGIYIVGPAANSNVVVGNLIGTDITGGAPLGNIENGLVISDGVANQIGGTALGTGNVISGNGQSGVYLLGNAAISNWVAGNFIGTDLNGTNRLGNASDGITVYGGAQNVIGGDQPAARNIISGNGARGVFITSTGAVANLILGNYIGTDFSGQRALSNTFAGVALAGASVRENHVGGTSALAGNVISGNGESGVAISDGAVANWVQGNLIGSDYSGTQAMGNAFNGVVISSASNRVGGTDVGAGNLISGNWKNGVYITTTNASLNQVQGNLIGSDISGHNILSNHLSGVLIEDAPTNLIGGTHAGCRNLISGNLNAGGVYLFGTRAMGNSIQGNLIGVDIDGLSALPNTNGVIIYNSPSNIIGGVSVSAGNIIGGSTLTGVYILGPGAVGNVMQGNFIGTDITGSRAIPNRDGGIFVVGSSNNLIGGTAPGTGNLISGNLLAGISVGSPGTVGNEIQGNFIGTQADGSSPLGNQTHNIEFYDNASNNVVGGLGQGAGNRIAFAQVTGYDGVRLRAGCTGNTIRGNSFFSNAGLGIDMGVDGPDPAGLVVLTSCTGRYRTRVLGSITGRPANRTFTLDFYVNSIRDSSGYGEGERWIYSTTVTTDATGRASFSRAFPDTSAVVGYISGTVTDSLGTTSEFGLSVLNLIAAVQDTDNDGLPDEYELAWGLNSADSSDAAQDLDGDGLSNLQEFRSGTNPLDPNSALRLCVVDVDNHQVLLSFPTVIGMHYTLRASDSVTSGWQDLASNLPGTGGSIILSDRSPSAKASRFYQLLFQ